MSRSRDQELHACPTCGGEVTKNLGLRDFSTWVNGALPGRAGATDIDALIERRGHLLGFEIKPSRYIPWGQRLTFDTLAAIPKWTQYIVVDKDFELDKLEVGRWVPGQGVVRWYPMSVAEVTRLTQQWWEEATASEPH